MRGFNDNWEFTPTWTEAFGRGEGTECETVRLPHTVKELPLHAIDHESFQMISGYRKKITLPDDPGKRYFIRFDGAAHIATVYVNGKELLTHRSGYTSFEAEFTEAARPGEENLVSVRLDSTENSEIPPFGYVIDYLTYGGLYRPAHLIIKGMDRISDVFVQTPDAETAKVRVSLDLKSDEKDSDLILKVLDHDGKVIGEAEGKAGEDILINCPGAVLWDTENPALYTLRTELPGRDVCETEFGFRTAEFRSDGFYLNNRKVFLRGLNRHQSWPYIGYAAPSSMQEEDARILKYELGLNAVRTSHYPQSHDFIRACDRLGLLVFTEIPGWQHIGDEGWKDQAVENVKEMVLQYRNHPSIVLWGVRINESLDDDEFYLRTNALCHELDPSRSTSGVRYLEKSSLLEDVYSFNDFSHTGNNEGVRPKAEVTTDVSKAFLISEHSGHMFPTKSFDNWERRQEHALRHARVLNGAMESGVHAGCFGWCMFDYGTHRDFGSGDRLCYHGVMDSFRNPKTAAALYLSQQDEEPVLDIGSSMDIGDYPGGQIGRSWVFTNCDEVRLYMNGKLRGVYDEHPFKGLIHSPVPVDDPIDHSWGGKAAVWRFDGIRNGEAVISRTLGGPADLKIEAVPSSSELCEKDTWDMAAVRIRVADGDGNIYPYAQLPISLKIEGEAELIGPDLLTAEGGMTGTYIRTLGRAGKAELLISSPGLESVRLTFDISIK